jgi:hypothetical protein
MKLVHDTYSRKNKEKLLKLYRMAKKSWTSARAIDRGARIGLAQKLSEFGWRVCLCPGEADVCIGRKAAKCPGQVTAVSADSDLLFYPIKSFLRKPFGSGSFVQYHLDEVVNTLKVNKSQFVVAGLVTNNDYSRHIPGQSFRKNLLVLMDCDAEDCHANLQKYCEIMAVDDSEMFKYSKEIFLEMKEDVVKVTRSNVEIDLTMKALVIIVSSYLDKYVQHIDSSLHKSLLFISCLTESYLAPSTQAQDLPQSHLLLSKLINTQGKFWSIGLSSCPIYIKLNSFYLDSTHQVARLKQSHSFITPRRPLRV